MPAATLRRRPPIAAGIAARTVLGPWPEVAHRTEPADVVVCGHVLYNVADAAPFVAELTAHARGRVVLEVRPSKHHAVSLYESFGFRVVGRRRGYYYDTGEDALVMEVALRGEPVPPGNQAAR